MIDGYPRFPNEQTATSHQAFIAVNADIEILMGLIP